MSRRFAFIISFALSSPALAADRVDYVREVRPILAARCGSCHGATRPKGHLRLDTVASALKGGDAGPAIVRGKAEASPLIDAILSPDKAERMPLNRPALPASEIATLRLWIDQGATAPPNETPDPTFGRHWAFIVPTRPEVPRVKETGWARNPIDAFIRIRLDREGIAPSPEADRITLIRRINLDLIGLPPSPAEVDAFLTDHRPDAYERAVDRLLASPHYGERSARRWLDLARYADSNGYSIDAPRSIWPYRDWVIDGFNRDMPFDQFAIEQIAGDLLPGATIAQKVATGFHRNTPINQEGGIDREQFRVESVVDRVNTTASAFLGLTMGCCQCHDHKYDPLSQAEYYKFFAFFNNADEPDLPIADPATLARRDAIETQVVTLLHDLRSKNPSLVDLQRTWETSLDMAGRQRQSEDVRAAFDVLFDKRTEAQRDVVFAAFIDQSPAAKSHKQAIAGLRKSVPKIVTTMVVRERPKPRATAIHLGGDFTRQGDRVAAGVPAVMPPIPPSPTDWNRLDLARWLVSRANPLTARVAVNRLWLAYFGRGLVETEDDFGTQGTPPSHLELLDWLSVEFMDRGWSPKALTRLIVTSATYRQSSRTRPDLASIDPSNRLHARQSRLRLDAEIVRDASLAVGGLLNPKVGGPSVFPTQPEGVMNFGQMRREWTADVGPDRYRRGLYTFLWRATPHPSLTVFDAPDGIRACSRRARSNTPLQALTLLNDRASIECAEGLAERLTSEPELSDSARMTMAFRLGLGRLPTTTESDRLARLLSEERASNPGAKADWTALARVILNLDEFITRE